MKEVSLTRGMVALVDDEDFDLASQYRWHAVSNGGLTFYAASNRADGARTVTTLMHCLIMGVDADGRHVDHRNLNGVDNRRSNLRWATMSQQRQNTGLSSRNTSGFKGVSRIGSKWKSQVQADGVVMYLGCYGSAEEAARAYDARAVELFGEFARLNFPQ